MKVWPDSFLTETFGERMIEIFQPRYTMSDTKARRVVRLTRQHRHDSDPLAEQKRDLT